MAGRNRDSDGISAEAASPVLFIFNYAWPGQQRPRVHASLIRHTALRPDKVLLLHHTSHDHQQILIAHQPPNQKRPWWPSANELAGNCVLMTRCVKTRATFSAIISSLHPALPVRVASSLELQTNLREVVQSRRTERAPTRSFF